MLESIMAGLIGIQTAAIIILLRRFRKSQRDRLEINQIFLGTMNNMLQEMSEEVIKNKTDRSVDKWN